MSNKASSPSVGGTFAGGIQDVAALLPLIGTEQCEKHVGSALMGGYLYAAAAPLSIFGSLGIVKAGIAILISSISISIPHLSISFHGSKPSVKYSGQQKWLGGRMFKDAGFELTGVVAPLIGIDDHRFKAETRLIDMLEEKHVDDPEKISVGWKSRQWNMMLVVSTILGAALSLVPYIALLLGPASWRPTSMHLPWLFPALRIVGSCTATVACQFIIQSRVISIMKNRILFMIIDRRLNAKYKQGVDVSLKDPKFTWDSSLSAEQCVWSLEQYISVNGPLTRHEEESNNEDDHLGVHRSERKSEGSDMSEMASGGSDHLSIQITTGPFQNSSAVPTQTSSASPTSFDINDLHRLQQEHFSTPALDVAFTVLLWIILGLSLPATVAGYIGCFTLVSATPTLGNGPLVWVGLEATLSMLRIFIWASNPSFDEETDVTLELKLSEHQPMVTTEDYNPWMTHFTHTKKKPFTLVPEREFLEWITPFTGPLDQFQKADNITLYFTLTTQNESNPPPFKVSTFQPEFLSLYMTVFDSNMQIGVSLMFTEGCFHYFDVVIKYDTISRKFEADVQSERSDTHTWRIEDVNLFYSLEKYYHYVSGAFSQRDITKITAILPWKWDLSQKSGPESRGNDISRYSKLPSLTARDRSFLNRGYEHQLKSDLVVKWSRWIVEDMRLIRSHTRLDCHEALRDMNSNKAKWELTELDVQLVWGWAVRELALFMLSKQLEDIFRAKLESCASEVNRFRKEKRLGMWMFESGRRKRMEHERGAAKNRMERAAKDAREQADREGRSWQGDPSFLPQWRKAIEFVDDQWSAGINNLRQVSGRSENELKRMIKQEGDGRWFHDVDDRHSFLARLMNRVSHENWCPQYQVEKQMMKTTVERISIIPADSARRDILTAYEYPEPDTESTVKFAELQDSSSQGKACSAIVYDTRRCGKESVCNVIAKSTTRSVLNVDPEILPSIPPNDHLLFLTCKDGKGEEPPFVQRNRDRWWEEQTTDSATFYFTPTFIDGDSCCLWSGPDPIAIARILVFLTVPSAIRVSLLCRSQNDDNGLSIQENQEVLGSTVSDIRSNFQLHDIQSFVLQPGRHELELVPQGSGPFDYYYLRDILIELSHDPTTISESTKVTPGVLNLPSVEDPELTPYNGWLMFLPKTGNKP